MAHPPEESRGCIWSALRSPSCLRLGGVWRFAALDGLFELDGPEVPYSILALISAKTKALHAIFLGACCSRTKTWPESTGEAVSVLWACNRNQRLKYGQNFWSSSVIVSNLWEISLAFRAFVFQKVTWLPAHLLWTRTHPSVKGDAANWTWV